MALLNLWRKKYEKLQRTKVRSFLPQLSRQQPHEPQGKNMGGKHERFP